MKTLTRGCVAGWMGCALLVPLGLSAQDRTAELEPYQVGQALPPAEPGATIVSLTLQEAIDRALERNLDIQSVRLAPEIQRYSLRAAEAAFAPTLNGTYGFNNSTNQSTSQLDGGQTTTTERQTFNLGLSQTVPWYGGQLSADFNNSRTETNNSFATLNPSFRSSVSLDYTQPLLAGRSIDNSRASVTTQRIQGEITDLQVLSQVENIMAQVRQAYWALRSAIEQIEIQRQNLAQAQQLLEDNRIRVEEGDLAEVQVVQAESQVASAEQALLNAEIQWRNQELAFKRLLVGGPDDPLLGETVNPTEQPVLVEVAVDIEDAVEVALRERTDIRQQRQQREIDQVNLEVSESNSLPDVTLNASYSLSGVGGDLFDRSGLGGEPQLVESGGFVDGLESIAEFETPTWNLSVSASYPVGNDPAKANLERAELQLRQTDLALRQQELQIVTQVTDAGLSVRNAFLQVEAARRAREAAERNLEAELTRFEVGVATNFEVVTAQDQATQARLSELQAIIDYVNAIADFERIQRVGGS